MLLHHLPLPTSLSTLPWTSKVFAPFVSCPPLLQLWTLHPISTQAMDVLWMLFIGMWVPKYIKGITIPRAIGVFSWARKKQPIVALSSIEDKYKWTRMVEENFGWHGQSREQAQLLCDNQSYMAIAKILVFHTSTKHIEIQYHFVCELIMVGEVDLV